jgi:hypothetical protein
VKWDQEQLASFCGAPAGPTLSRSQCGPLDSVSRTTLQHESSLAGSFLGQRTRDMESIKRAPRQRKPPLPRTQTQDMDEEYEHRIKRREEKANRTIAPKLAKFLQEYFDRLYQ